METVNEIRGSNSAEDVTILFLFLTHRPSTWRRASAKFLKYPLASIYTSRALSTVPDGKDFSVRYPRAPGAIRESALMFFQGVQMEFSPCRVYRTPPVPAQ